MESTGLARRRGSNRFRFFPPFFPAFQITYTGSCIPALYFTYGGGVNAQLPHNGVVNFS